MVGTFLVGRASVRVWRNGGHWVVAVDDVEVGGRHMSEAQAAGTGLIHAQPERMRAGGIPERNAPVRAFRPGARRKVA